MIEAKIVCDSVGPSMVRLTTFVLTYPRFIHSEFMTHRVFSRNASSSRAIPVKKQIKMVKENPAIPLAFAANKAGMQAGEKFGPFKQFICRTIWLGAMRAAVFFATLMEKLNVAKQYANRILEPWAHITVVCTATDWENFFALRCHDAAQPEIHALADKMYYEMTHNQPKTLELGEWHLPFIYMEDKKYDHRSNPQSVISELLKRSVARCARVSYLNHEGKRPTLVEDLKLYDRLVGSAPIHASPAEHQALTMTQAEYRSGNFRGWEQYRQMLPNQNVLVFRIDK
jgi:hypothetical protein